MALVVPHAEALPIAAILLLDLDLPVVHVVGRNLKLHESTGLEVDVLTLGELQVEFLDEGRDIVIVDHLALPTLNSEGVLGDANTHGLFDRHLAGEPPLLANLAA